jgi:thiamine kinase-like enzyme
VRLAERIEGAATPSDDDRDWLHGRLANLRLAYEQLPPGLPASVIHGDAWAGNVVTTADGRVVLLDLERCSVGRPKSDLVSTAVRYSSFGTIDARQYGEFAAFYGHDVVE